MIEGFGSTIKLVPMVLKAVCTDCFFLLEAQKS